MRTSVVMPTSTNSVRNSVSSLNLSQVSTRRTYIQDVALMNACLAILDLNNGSSAFCGLFWDPESNWIVVAMKGRPFLPITRILHHQSFNLCFQFSTGTGPIEFGEWLTDLDATMVPCELYMTRFHPHPDD